MKGARVLDIELSKIKVREGHNPREDYGLEDGTMRELVASIRTEGVLHPPILRAADPTGFRYFIVAGHRRIAAAKHLKIEHLTCTCLPYKEGSEREDAILALVENIQRKSLRPIEQAKGFKALLQSGLSQLQIAERVGVSQPFVSNSLALLQLPEEVKADLQDGKLSKSQGEELIGLMREGHPASTILDTAEQVRGRTCLETRAIVKTIRQAGSAPRSAAPRPAPEKPTEEELERWAVRRFGSMRAALLELKKLVEAPQKPEEDPIG